ncbi:ARPP-1 family domain-containing protein [Parafilimonas sp.]|uniref:ARPP-1 family domain-containing protein n=1 Tax=Parafilimonas sp. TaxID=1969739 RepID=UPI0039E50603
MLKSLLNYRWHCLMATIIFCHAQIFAQFTYNELSVQYDSPWTYKKLQLIPVRFKNTGKDSGYAGTQMFNGKISSFDDAMRRHKIIVKEVSEGGADVSTLMIKNRSNENIMLMSGEMVQGGKQDRAFGETTIIPKGKRKNYVQAFCVEKGRWDSKPKSFRHAGTADAGVRKQIDVSKRQSKVWKQIDDELVEKNKKNQTSAYLNAYNDSNYFDTSYLHYFIEKMKSSDSAYAGFIAVTGNRIIRADIFGGTDVCLAAYMENIKSYVHSLKPEDGIPSKPKEAIKGFTDKFLKDKTTQKQYLSKNGRIYYSEGNIIQIVAYDDR